MMKRIDDFRSKKRIDLEIIRIIAVVFVMINHTSTNGFVIEKVHNNSIVYLSFLFIVSLSRVAVPLFFMVSGALLIKKEESIKDVVKKRVFRYAIIILLFSVIQYFLMRLWGYTEYEVKNVWEFLSTIYVKPFIIPYWFLYAYLGLMILLPFLRKMVRAMSKNDFKYLIILHLLLFVALQVFEYFTDIGRINLSIPFACEVSFFFFILGYYIESLFTLNKKVYLLLVVFSIISVSLLTLMVNWNITRNGDYLNLENYNYSSSLIIFPTVLIYVTANKFSKFFDNKRRLRSILVWVGGTTFGIYLMENVFERLCADVYFISQKFVHPFFSWFLWIFCSFFIGALLVSVFNVFRILKKRVVQAICSRISNEKSL